MTPRTLSTADVRREALLEAALPLFAQQGVSGTPTLAVAQASGISQAYLFRLFPKKSDLVIALVERTNERIHETMASAAATAKAVGDEVIPAMGAAYVELLQQNRDLLLFQMHAHAASAELPEVREATRGGFARLHALVREQTGEGDEEIRSFFASGMLLNVIAALDIWELDEPWAVALVGDKARPGC